MSNIDLVKLLNQKKDEMELKEYIVCPVHGCDMHIKASEILSNNTMEVAGDIDRTYNHRAIRVEGNTVIKFTYRCPQKCEFSFQGNDVSLSGPIRFVNA